MKKPTMKRLLLGLLQQSAALLLSLAVAAILFHSYLTVDSVNGTKVYEIAPLNTETDFEDSEIFFDIFDTSVQDVLELVKVRELLETDGSFEGTKEIDVTFFASGTSDVPNCAVTASYTIEDLIKWGKYGIEYSTRSMSVSDFVNYFGPASSVDNFRVDSEGELYFAGFLASEFNPHAGNGRLIESELPAMTEEERAIVQAAMDALPADEREETLEDMAYSYLVRECQQEIDVSREDDGSLTVYFPLLSCRYTPTFGEKQLVAYAGNWVEYAQLQENVVHAIETFSKAYTEYQTFNDQYKEGAGNLLYVVRSVTADGTPVTTTNLPDLTEYSNNEITDYFSEYRRYLIYYPDSLEFTGNTDVTQDEIYEALLSIGYEYPEETYVWIGVDTSYPVPGDTLYTARGLFDTIVPNIWYLIGASILLGILWVGLWFYLTFTAGVIHTEEGEPLSYLNFIDHAWTEVLLAFVAAFVYAAYLGETYLVKVTNEVYVSQTSMTEEGFTRLFEYGAFALYGFLFSLCFNTLWYSLVRRVRCGNLWQDSLCHAILSKLKFGANFVVLHSNSAISSLVPYNFFLLINLGCVLAFYFLREVKGWRLLPLAVILILDTVVGVIRFKQRAEQLDIVEGIRRIRDGEVDYKLDVENLHGDNREMADAVNNIGEGIRRAVDTSMRDEQMKSDLITNVSHDIKTPLTSIINYVDLLKRLKITEEPAGSYIAVLDSKSQRLKQLTDDLVEASKISSGNITLDNVQLDLTELFKQAIGEFADRFAEKGLTTVYDGENAPVYVYADSRRMWRIIENLFQNVCKYALEGTRVYIVLHRVEGAVELSMKNISERPIGGTGEELTERFVRGDASRTTEGTGLGLYIAQNLAKAMKGELHVEPDGDLFKVVLRFPESSDEMTASMEAENQPQ